MTARLRWTLWGRDAVRSFGRYVLTLAVVAAAIYFAVSHVLEQVCAP